MTVLLLSLFVLVTPSIVNAQSLSAEDIKAQMVKEWERSKAYTIDYLNTMPANKYSFKAVDSIRSFAQQMLHLAGAMYSLCHWQQIKKLLLSRKTWNKGSVLRLKTPLCIL
jgi:hypothetical protein